VLQSHRRTILRFNGPDAPDAGTAFSTLQVVGPCFGLALRGAGPPRARRWRMRRWVVSLALCAEADRHTGVMGVPTPWVSLFAFVTKYPRLGGV